MFTRFRFLAAAFVLSAIANSAHAGTVNFTYTADPVGFSGSVSGTGSFSYTGTSTTVTIQDITSFNFQLVVVDDSAGESGTYDFHTYDLGAISGTLNGDTLLTLSLGTAAERQISGDLTGIFTFQDFGVNDLGAGDSGTFSIQGTTTSTGTVTQDITTPEPGSIVLMATGGLALFSAVRRRLSNARN